MSLHFSSGTPATHPHYSRSSKLFRNLVKTVCRNSTNLNTRHRTSLKKGWSFVSAPFSLACDLAFPAFVTSPRPIIQTGCSLHVSPLCAAAHIFSCLSKKIQRQQYLGKRFTGFLWIPHAKGASTSPVFPKRTSNSVRTDHFHILALEFGL